MKITPALNRGLTGRLGTLVLLVATAAGCSQSAPDPVAPQEGVADFPPGQGGLTVNDAKAYQGYTLIAPIRSTSTFLIDMEGRVVKTWTSDCIPALGACLLENGHLLRTGTLPKEEAPYIVSGGGGRIQEFTWEGDLVWDFKFAGTHYLPHHDITKLPNGNVLLVVSERKTVEEGVAVGRKRDVSNSDGYLMSDWVVEIKPTGRTTGEVVWEWHIWDHLVQDHDPRKSNHGSVPAHPELIDINYGVGGADPALALSGKDLDKLRGLGYVSASGSTPNSAHQGDWSHMNSVAYNPDLDQIAVTLLGFREFWIIDHSTTKAEAAGHTGGRYGRGGDLLYRWGNPQSYGHDVTGPQLFAPHNAHWIPKGLPDEGHVLIFNNGIGLPGHGHSSVDQIVLPSDEGKYLFPLKENDSFGPNSLTWHYDGNRKSDFFSPTFSSAQRLPNGNTLICLGLSGTSVEVTSSGEVVWKYAYTGHPIPPNLAKLDHMRLHPANALFRSVRYAKNYPGLADRELKPEGRPH